MRETERRDVCRGQIPISSVIAKLDAYLNREDYQSAHRLLLYWRDEAQQLGDRRGEISIQSEIMGFSRRIQDREGGLAAVWRGFELIAELQLTSATAGTFYLNGATTLKAFGEAEEAMPYYEKARACYAGSVNDTDPLWGGFYNNYALALADLGRVDEALACYRKAMDVMALQSNGGLEIAVTLMNMAELFEKTGERAEDIEQTLQQAWQYLEDPAIERGGYYAFVCRKCAPTFGHFGWLATQRELDERADAIYEGA